MDKRVTTEEFSGQFFVGEVEGLGWLALTPETNKQEVYFCIHGNTQEEAVDNAFEAISFYIEYINKSQSAQPRGITVSAAKRLPFKSVEQVFVPREVVFAHAC